MNDKALTIFFMIVAILVIFVIASGHYKEVWTILSGKKSISGGNQAHSNRPVGPVSQGNH